MSVREVTYYIAVCDCCGAEADYGDFSAMSDVGQAMDYGDIEHIDGDDLCSDCYQWSEEGEWDELQRRNCNHPEAAAAVQDD